MEEKITIDTIDYLSDLSKLKFTDDEKNILVNEVNGIINLLSQCEEIEVDDDNGHKTQLLTDLRADDVRQEMSADDVFVSTQNAHNGYFVCPKVVD